MFEAYCQQTVKFNWQVGARSIWFQTWSASRTPLRSVSSFHWIAGDVVIFCCCHHQLTMQRLHPKGLLSVQSRLLRKLSHPTSSISRSSPCTGGHRSLYAPIGSHQWPRACHWGELRMPGLEKGNVTMVSVLSEILGTVLHLWTIKHRLAEIAKLWVTYGSLAFLKLDWEFWSWQFEYILFYAGEIVLQWFDERVRLSA